MGASSFNDMEIDAIGEIMNISLGASATAVSTMLGAMVNITTPVVKVLSGEEFEFRKIEPAIGVEVSYTEGLEGNNIMMFSRNDVRIIVGTLMGAEIPEEVFELDEINRSAICEVMNQMMGSSATALSEFLGFPINISTPISFEVENELSFKDKYFPTEDRKVVVRFTLEVEDKLESEFYNIMSLGLAKCLLEPFGLSGEPESETVEVSQPAVQEPAPEEPAPSNKVLSQEEIQRMLMQAGDEEPQSQPAPEEPAASNKVLSQEEIQRMLMQAEAEVPEVSVSHEEQPPQMVQPEPQIQPEPQPQIQPVPQPAYNAPPQVYQAAPDPMMLQLLNQMQQSQMQMMEIMRDMKTKEKPQRTEQSSLIRPLNSAQLNNEEAERGEEEQANQEMLMKVPLGISVEIGRTKKRVKEILEFTQGSLVVLDKMAGEQADLFVNGQCIAKGDIVVVEDNFGIRITEIISRNINPESL